MGESSPSENRAHCTRRVQTLDFLCSVTVASASLGPSLPLEKWGKNSKAFASTIGVTFMKWRARRWLSWLQSLEIPVQNQHFHFYECTWQINPLMCEINLGQQASWSSVTPALLPHQNGWQKIAELIRTLLKASSALDTRKQNEVLIQKMDKSFGAKYS